MKYTILHSVQRYTILHFFRAFVLISCVSFFIFPPDLCFGQSSQASSVPAASEPALPSPEGKFIVDLGDKATEVLVDTTLSPAQLDSKFQEMLGSAFDVETVGEFVVGRTWVRLNQEQRQEYQKLFKEFLLRNYGNRLREYNGEKLKVTQARPQGEHAFVVSTVIVHPFGLSQTSIDWVVRRRGDGKLVIVDVVIDGVSQSLTQRDEFASILARNGGDFGALLDALREDPDVLMVGEMAKESGEAAGWSRTAATRSFEAADLWQYIDGDAEKYLKAFLVSRQIEFPKTHDLEELLELLEPVHSELAAALEGIEMLSPFGVKIRYPGDFPELLPGQEQTVFAHLRRGIVGDVPRLEHGVF